MGELGPLESTERPNGLTRVRTLEGFDQRRRVVARVLDGKQMGVERPLNEEQERCKHEATIAPLRRERHPD